MVPPVDLYLDYGCPWSYLALIRLSETALRTGARMVFRPVVLNWVLKRTQPPLAPDPTEKHPARKAYQNKDINDWARFCGLTLNRPQDWPALSEMAACGALAADDQGGCANYSKELFGAYFTTGDDIDRPATLVAAAARAGLDTDRFTRELAAPTLRQRLEENCDHLVQRGGFGTPTMFVDQAMFFGHDRVPLVEFAIGQASGRRFIAPGDHSA